MTILCLLNLHTAFSKTAENIIIITTDGLRWQEDFSSMDSAIANNKIFNPVTFFWYKHL
ncbi:MAG: hypothetical protein WBO39_17130 [Ferruginibacter sp.]|nr:hypothetical protein [Chitinophagaceae bacterium]